MACRLLSGMDSNDLFSFLDETSPQENSSHEADGDVVMKPEVISKSASARKRKVPTPSAPFNGVSAPSEPGEPGPSEPKRPRLGSPKPVVVDEVEIEAKREVAASAGLTGTVEEGSRLELRHQVCVSHSAFLNLRLFVTKYRAGATPGRSTARVPIRTDYPACPSREAGARIQVYAGPVPAGVGARDSA